MSFEQDQYRSELLALIARHKDFWSRSSAAMQKLSDTCAQLELTKAKIRPALVWWRRDSRDYRGLL